MDDAIRKARAVFACAGTLDQEPFVISSLVGSAVDVAGVSAIERVLAFGQVRDAVLAQTTLLLELRESVDRLWWALTGERAMLYESCEYLLSANKVLPEHMPNVCRYVPGWVKLDILHGIRRLDAIVDAAQGPPRDILSRMRGIDGSAIPKYFVLTKIFTTEYSRFAALSLGVRAALRSAIAGLAAERFRIATGHWPDSLQELVPDYIWPRPRAIPSPERS